MVQRNNIIPFKSVCGEAASVDNVVVNTGKAKIPDNIAN